MTEHDEIVYTPSNHVFMGVIVSRLKMPDVSNIQIEDGNIMAAVNYMSNKYGKGVGMSVEAEAMPVVMSAYHMPAEDFIKHMNMRHADSIGGLHSLWLIHQDVTESWRSFHDRLHTSGSRSHKHEGDE